MLRNNADVRRCLRYLWFYFPSMIVLTFSLYTSHLWYLNYRKYIDLARAKSEALLNIYSFLKEN